ncbi:MAG TPA: patatin-like phospholipase family protein [Tepidisphaeraceae bacterium]|jgi:predicted acylesterase/phospholipase RssA
MRIFRLSIAAVLLACLQSGCTYANRRLNPQTIPAESRTRNQTRSAVLADVTSIQHSDTEPDATAIAVTAPATAPGVPRPASPDDRDGYFVGIAISGGGSRSANFSAACMLQLQRVGLLQRADYISSVSGGSLTAAYYCVCDDQDWNAGNLQRKLSHGFATDIIVDTFTPWNFFALIFSDYDRSDLLAKTLRRNLFTRRGRALTYNDLRADRPHLLINATNLQSGRRFIFCNETFDELNSNLKDYPIAYAVAASASFPIVMHQVTLRDYSTIFKQYQHLIDGGVTDNLGIQTLVETYEAQIAAARANGRADPYPHGALLICLDARTQFDARLSDKGDIGFIQSLRTGTNLTSTALLTRAGSATLSEIILKHSPDEATAAELRKAMRTLDDSGFLRLRDRTGHDMRVVRYALADVNQLKSIPFRSFSEKLNGIATYFNIDDTEVYNLYQAAELLMKEKFETRLREINQEMSSTTAPAASQP